MDDSQKEDTTNHSVRGSGVGHELSAERPGLNVRGTRENTLLDETKISDRTKSFFSSSVNNADLFL